MDLGDDVSGHCLSHPAELGLRLDVPAAQGEGGKHDFVSKG